MVARGGRLDGVEAPLTGRRLAIMLCAVLVAATGLRIATADYSLWYDELASLEFASQPLAHLWSSWMLRETNPPLFYSLVGQWVAVAGHGDVVVRLLPIAIGVAGIGAAFGLGRAVGDARAGLLAAALLSLSALHVDLSHQLRAYGLAHTAVLVACIGMVGFVRRRTSGGLILYGSATLVALYAHTTLALFAGLAGLTMLVLLRGDRAAQMRWLLANSVVFACWGWWAMMSVRQLQMPVTNIAWIATPSFADAVDMAALVYLPLYVHATGILSAALLALLFVAIGGWAIRSTQPEVRLLATVTIAPPVLLFVISQRVPILLPRTLGWASGPELVLVALAVTRIPSVIVARASAAILLGWSAIGLVGWLPIREREPWRQSVATLERLGSPVVIVGDDAVALAIGQYRTGTRPLVPIVVQSAYRERWSSGLYTGPHLTTDAARALIGESGCVSVLEWGPFHPPVLDDPAMVVVPVTRDASPSVSLVRATALPRNCGGGTDSGPVHGKAVVGHGVHSYGSPSTAGLPKGGPARVER